MLYRFCLLIALLLSCICLKAQTVTFNEADSISIAQYNAGNWQALLKTGNRAITSGVDYPILRLRMGYAAYMLQNYSNALQQYDAVLANDSYNQTALIYAYWCNIYLNRQSEASYYASFIDTNYLKNNSLNSPLTEAGVQNSLKLPATGRRNNADYSRVFLGNRFGRRLLFDESVAYFHEHDEAPMSHQQNPDAAFDRDQLEYHGKLTFSLNKNTSLIGAYHYLRTNVNNHIGLIGVKKNTRNFEYQADLDFSYLKLMRIYQYNGLVSWYPNGNLNLYISSLVALQYASGNQLIFNQLIGGKIFNNVWAEVFATFGRQDNYLEYDALYVYNSVDVTQFKAGATFYFRLNPHLYLPLNYMFETKKNSFESLIYRQHSITATLQWRF